MENGSAPARKSRNPDSERVQRWREANRERYNANMRAYMKRRREHEHAAKEPQVQADDPAGTPEKT